MIDTETYRTAWALAAHRGMTWNARVINIGDDHGAFRNFLLTTGWKNYYIGIGPEAIGEEDLRTIYRSLKLHKVRLPCRDRLLDAAFCLHETYDTMADKPHLLREMKRVADLVVVLSEKDLTGETFQETGSKNGLFWGAWRRKWKPRKNREPRVRHFRIGSGPRALEQIPTETTNEHE